MTPEEMKAQILRAAGQLGFADCRVAEIRGEAPHADLFRQWIADGSYGDMAWMAKNPHRRADPREVLPGAQAVVVLALNYYQSDPPSPAANAGRIAKYAWGDDYHDLIEKKLDSLSELLDSLGGRQRRYVDTGPILERDWASAAGLGWNGKSTVQIHPKIGCYFFLGEILTTLPLPGDAPATDHCGKCTRCLTACPTGAIDRPHHVEARRCLSYLTIEHKGPIPHEFRRVLGHRIYGCDDCLAACPWNRFARAAQESAFAARACIHDWKLRDFLPLTDEEFRDLFRRNPIKRLKRHGFLRNVCVALGNVGTGEDLPALCAAAADPHPLISEHAAWALAEIRQRLLGMD